MRRNRVHLLSAALLALSGLVTTTAVAGAVEPARPGAESAPLRAEPLQVRIGTYNIMSRVSVDTFKRVVSQVKPAVDVLGLQEIGANAKHQWLMASDFNWTSYRPPQLQQNPVLWDRTQFDFVSGEGVKLSDGHSVEGRNGGGPEAKKNNWATVVRLFHRASGQQISFINVHLLTGTVIGGRFAKGRPQAKKMYTTQLRNLIGLARSEQSRSNQVYVLGDYNSGYKADIKWRQKQLPVKQFKRIGYRSMWENSPFLNKRYGTRNDALIDQVFARQAPVGTQILTDVSGSDHRPAVATYQMPAPDPAYVAPVGSIGFAGPPPVRDEYTKKTGKFVEVQLTGDLSHGYARVVVNAEESTAVEGEDFYIDPTSYLPGSHTIYIKIIKDGITEPDETYVLQLVDPVNAEVIPGQDTVTGIIAANKS